MKNQADKILGGVAGALLADAASLGLHWLYDPERIAHVVNAHGHAAFIAPNAEHFQGVPAYFAHAHRHNGQLSQYGESMLLAVHNLVEHRGTLNIPAYQKAYLEHFGMGGSYRGYIDKPTRATLAHLSAGHTTPSGIEDDQHPALTRVVPLVAVSQDLSTIKAPLKDAIEITNLGAEALDYSLIFADLLHRVLQGESIEKALVSTAKTACAAIGKQLTDALNSTESDSIKYAEITQRACHLKQGLPLSFHILRHTNNYRDAVELNIRAGGDSCGRALIIGSVYGASMGTAGLPVDWLLQLSDGHRIWKVCQRLSEL